MMISPVSLLTTSSGIFSPSKNVARAPRSAARAARRVFLLIVFLDLLWLTLRLRSAVSFSRVDFLLGGDLHVHDDAVGAGRNLQRRVFHVGRFLTENGAEQALFRSEFGFALRSDLADENVAGLYFRADADDAVRAEVSQRFFAEVRNIARDFFRAELRVAGADLEFIDVNRGVDVLLDDASR